MLSYESMDCDGFPSSDERETHKDQRQAASQKAVVARREAAEAREHAGCGATTSAQRKQKQRHLQSQSLSEDQLAAMRASETERRSAARKRKLDLMLERLSSLPACTTAAAPASAPPAAAPAAAQSVSGANAASPPSAAASRPPAVSPPEESSPSAASPPPAAASPPPAAAATTPPAATAKSIEAAKLHSDALEQYYAAMETLEMTDDDVSFEPCGFCNARCWLDCDCECDGSCVGMPAFWWEAPMYAGPCECNLRQARERANSKIRAAAQCIPCGCGAPGCPFGPAAPPAAAAPSAAAAPPAAPPAQPTGVPNAALAVLHEPCGTLFTDDAVGPRKWFYDDNMSVPRGVIRCHGMNRSDAYARFGNRCRITSGSSLAAAKPLQQGSFFCSHHGGLKRSRNHADLPSLHDYNEQGLDTDGFDRDGFAADGFDRDGYSRQGWNRSGYGPNTGVGCEPYRRNVARRRLAICRRLASGTTAIHDAHRFFDRKRWCRGKEFPRGDAFVCNMCLAIRYCEVPPRAPAQWEPCYDIEGELFARFEQAFADE